MEDAMEDTMQDLFWMQKSTKGKLEYMRENDEDCTFSVCMKNEEEPQQLKGYKQVLSNVSPVFERMFNGDFKEAKSSDPVIIEDIYVRDFRQFLAFVYDDDVYVTNWKSLYAIAKKYMADMVIDKIIYKLHSRKPYETLYRFEIMYLEGKTEYSYDDNLDRIEKALESPCIHHLDPSVFLHLITILPQRYFPISHAKLFVAIDRYCANEGHFSSDSEKLNFAALCLSSIRLKKMTAKEFVDFVEPSDLLDLPTKYKTLVDICHRVGNSAS